MITSKRGLNRRAFLSKAAAFLPCTLAHPFARLAAAEPFPRFADAPLAVNPAAGPIRFALAPPSCGLDFVLRNGAQGRKYQVETLLGGLGVIDLTATAGLIFSA